MSVSMQLTDLIADRETPADNSFPIPQAEVLARYERLYTGAVSDVLREICLTEQALPHTIRPLRDDMAVAGFAFTIRSVVDPKVTGEMDTRAEMLERLYEDAVCVWNANGDDDAAHWGEVMTATSRARGCRGAVIDGGLRDTRQVLDQGFPVFYRYRSPNGSLSRCRITSYQEPVRIGATFVRPGDVIFGDIDGVIVIPRERALQVLARAEEIADGESELRRWVREGLTAEEIVKRGGYF